MSTLTPCNLRCEYVENPIGMDVPAPRLMWRSESSKRGARQTAWQVIVSSTRKGLDAGKGDVWDSGKVMSDDSIGVVYGGRKLASRERAYWKVRVWDNAGSASKWSDAAFWETGLLDREEWTGEWIGSPLVGGPRTTSPAPYLRKEFRVEEKVRSARLYVTALGVYEFYLNGKVVSGDVFRPGWTDYAKRVQYNVYDVTGLLKKGTNAAGAILGDGWYCGYLGPFNRQFYGDRPKLLAQIAVTYEDGSTVWVATDGTWKTSTGPILESDMLMGESHDARLEMPGWNVAGFDDSAWWGAAQFDDPGMAIVAQAGPPVRRMLEIKAKKIKDGYDAKWRYNGMMFDMRQNMVGRMRLKVRGKRGTTIHLSHAEALQPDGKLYTENLRGAEARNHYTLSGDGEETWEPLFTFHGFRYVEISSTAKFEVIEATGVVLYSDIPLTGEFECSDALVNQLQKNIQWGQRGNFLEVPTDCPQRDERLGWTGDALVFAPTAAFNMDVAGFFTKWQKDLEDGMSEEGGAPPVAPAVLGKSNTAPSWGDAVIVCPWTIYLCYGDRRLLEEYYETLTRFVEFQVKTSKKGLRCEEGSKVFCFGDWLALDGSGTLGGGTPNAVIGTAWFARSVWLMAQVAGALGNTEDAKRWTKQFETIRKAFIREFVTPAGLVAGGTQTAYTLALRFGLLPEHLRAAAVEQIVLDIKKRGMHLSTGFVGACHLPHVLTDGGRTDIVYELLHQKTWPSWLYAVTQDATTIWERWDGWTHDKGFQDPGMNSFNHYAYGAIGEWLYGTVAGIGVDPEKPGYKHIVLRPSPGGGLISASGKLRSMYGEIVSEWKIVGGKFTWNVTVPPNTNATAWIPAKSRKGITESGRPIAKATGVKFVREEDGACVCEIGSGNYKFVVKQ